MLNLAAPTPPGWAERALPHLDLILLDHAHCEKKAASTAVGFLFRYPEFPSLMTPLSRLAREELAHFEEVLRHLARRSVPFTRLHPSPYAGKLIAVARSGERQRLLDTLMCCALIEARSCERMKLLSEALPGVDGELAELYRGLLASEARHHHSYVEMAEEIFPREEVRERLRVVAAHEAEVILNAPRLPRLHNL